LISMATPQKPIKELMADCTISTVNDFRFEHQLLRNIGGINIELFDLIFNISITSHLQFAILNLAIKNFRLYQCIDDCLFNGYYEVGLQLMRSMYENILLMQFFIQEETAAEKWLNGKKYKSSYVRKKVEGGTKLYGMLSDLYVHANLESLIPIIKSLKENILEVIIYPEYSKEKATFNIQLSILYGWLNNSHLQYAFREYLWKNEEWKERYIEWNEIVMTYVDEKLKKDYERNLKEKNSDLFLDSADYPAPTRLFLGFIPVFSLFFILQVGPIKQ